MLQVEAGEGQGVAEGLHDKGCVYPKGNRLRQTKWREQMVRKPIGSLGCVMPRKDHGFCCFGARAHMFTVM